MNILIFTDDPAKAFAEAKTVLDTHALGKNVRAAYCEIDESEYQILWPKDLRDFDVA